MRHVEVVPQLHDGSVTKPGDPHRCGQLVEHVDAGQGSGAELAALDSELVKNFLLLAQVAASPDRSLDIEKYALAHGVRGVLLARDSSIMFRPYVQVQIPVMALFTADHAALHPDLVTGRETSAHAGSSETTGAASDRAGRRVGRALASRGGTWPRRGRDSSLCQPIAQAVARRYVHTAACDSGAMIPRMTSATRSRWPPR